VAAVWLAGRDMSQRVLRKRGRSVCLSSREDPWLVGLLSVNKRYFVSCGCSGWAVGRSVRQVRDRGMSILVLLVVVTDWCWDVMVGKSYCHVAVDGKILPDLLQ
jgi:hypothetical protein